MVETLEMEDGAEGFEGVDMWVGRHVKIAVSTTSLAARAGVSTWSGAGAAISIRLARSGALPAYSAGLTIGQ